MKFDTVIKGRRLVSASETTTADVRNAGGQIVALVLDLPAK